MNNFRIVFKNTFYLTLSEFFLKFIGFIWIIFLAHTLSVDLFGKYNFVNSFIAIFSFLPDLGVGLIIIREIAKNKDRAHIYLGNSIILNGILAFITFLLISFSLLFFSYPPDTKILIVIAAITLFISTLRSVGIFFFDGTERMQYSAALNSFNTILLIVGGSTGLLTGFGLKGVFIGMLIGTIVSTLTTWAFVIEKYRIPSIRLNTKLTKEILSDGLPLGLAAFSALVYSKIDSVLLGQLLNERAVGIYNSATPFAFTSIQLLNVPFMVAVFPALARLADLDHSRFKKAVLKSLVPIALWSFPVAIIISLFSPFIIPSIFGDRYLEAVPVLQTLIFFVPFASMSALLYKVLIVKNKQIYYLYISIFGAVLNIILNLFLIPKMGIMGAAISSVTTQVLLFLIYAIVVGILLKKIHA